MPPLPSTLTPLAATAAQKQIPISNSRMLQAAREADLKSNPPKEGKEVIMNYSPLRGEEAK